MARMNSFKTSVLACSVVCLGLGCSSDDSVNVGDGMLKDKSRLESYQGSWDGYVEAYTFPSGTDRVRVVLDANGNGQLRVGDADILPPPTNPDVGYPDAVSQRVEALEANSEYDAVNAVPAQLWDGIAYPITGARIESERIRFAVDPGAAFTQWCGLQTTYQVSADPLFFSCLPLGAYCYINPTNPTEGCGLEVNLGPGGSGCGTEPVDCGKAAICFFCACTANGCTSASQYSVPLDAALSADGHELVGTIVLADPGVGARTIRLKR